MIKSICVFCGSSAGRKPHFKEAAEQAGKLIAERGWRLVYGGGRTGLMGAVADATLAAGGEVVGVIPAFLDSREIAHQGVTELETVETMHQRKARMEELSDAFLALPGGFGTFEELLEMITWAQLGLHQKPIGALNVEAFYQPLALQVERAIEDGFIGAKFQSLLLMDESLESLFDKLVSFNGEHFESFLERKWT